MESHDDGVRIGPTQSRTTRSHASSRKLRRRARRARHLRGPHPSSQAPYASHTAVAVRQRSGAPRRRPAPNREATAEGPPGLPGPRTARARWRLANGQPRVRARDRAAETTSETSEVEDHEHRRPRRRRDDLDDTDARLRLLITFPSPHATVPARSFPSPSPAPARPPSACRRPAPGPPASRLGCPAIFYWQVEEGGSSAKRWTPLPRESRRDAVSRPGRGGGVVISKDLRREAYT